MTLSKKSEYFNAYLEQMFGCLDIFGREEPLKGTKILPNSSRGRNRRLNIIFFSYFKIFMMGNYACIFFHFLPFVMKMLAKDIFFLLHTLFYIISTDFLTFCISGTTRQSNPLTVHV